jgi:hypothetical protein
MEVTEKWPRIQDTVKTDESHSKAINWTWNDHQRDLQQRNFRHQYAAEPPRQRVVVTASLEVY